MSLAGAGGLLRVRLEQGLQPVFAIDGDPNGDGNPADAVIVGSLVSSATGGPRTDDTVSGLAGRGGQGVLAVPVVYDGWVQKLPPAWSSKQTCRQRDPLRTTC